VDDVREVPGQGLEALFEGTVIRLGRADWALDDPAAVSAGLRYPSATLSRNGRLLAVFAFQDRLRQGATEAIVALQNAGLDIEILSGDHDAAVRNVANVVGVAQFEAGVRPDGKLARLKALADFGHRIFMVGDGLNDAPALAAAHVSMAPSSAVDIGRNAADFVFMRDGLEAVPFAINVARRARRLIRENFALAVLYNAVALPFAIAGFVTPLAAALAMSGSSLIVVANAMRLSGGVTRAGSGRQPAGTQAVLPTAAAWPAG
jgi:Cu2+-exporting ATPase